MKSVFKILLIGLVTAGCTKRNCVKTSDLAFADLDEGNRAFYNFSVDTFSVSICQYITPNDDGINETFEMNSNLQPADYISTSFRVVNACEDIVHVEKNSFPFSFPDPKTLEDGQYDFTFSILLEESKNLVSGGGIIRVLRK